MFQTICNIIVLIGATFAAIVETFNIMGKPLRLMKKRRQQEADEYRKRIASEVTVEVSKKLQPTLDEIKQQNTDQAEQIAILTKGSKDMLRKHILDIYYAYKPAKAIPETVKKMLDSLFHDYTAEHGNSYVADKYEKMCKWTIIPDDDD